MIIITVINYQFFTILGITGISMLYLLVVVASSYFQTYLIAVLTAYISFLLINYFFVEPRYTFQVNHIESWASLLSFLVVSLVVSSLVKKLKRQTSRSNRAYQSAAFSRKLAEHLSLSENLDSLLSDSCRLLETEFGKPISMALTDKNNHYLIHFSSGESSGLDQSAIEWAANNGKPIGPYTGNWPNSPFWLLPFSRLPSRNPILVVGNVQEEINAEVFDSIRSAADQIASAYQRLVNLDRAKKAELTAHDEATQSALLASIAHDMRTPLTSILGAATTLQHAHINNDENLRSHLTSIIASQAKYLANTTENILSLIQLESKSIDSIAMDLQSPEEIIGIVIGIYKERDDPVNFKVTISDAELLIRVNASLLVQAIINLIENAKSANASKLHSISTVELDVYKTASQIHISVSDHGAGFDEAFDVSKIKKFNSNKPKGFGLGLSIVQAIANTHHANLTIKNLKEGGACVTLSFQIPNIDISYV